MDLFLYIVLFMIGTVFGSFFTLAVYRIPLKKDITHERSFCTTCGHRLEFFDLIPVLSYIFIGGKCRYCGERIRIRYFILEVLSGIVFVFSYISLKMHFPYFDFQKILYFISFIFLYITLAITAGIDKEHKQINLNVILFGFVMQTVYILYLYILKNSINIYRYGIYFVLVLIMLLLNSILSKKIKIKSGFNNSPYSIQILLLILYIIYCIDIKMASISIVTSILLLTANSILKQNKTNLLKEIKLNNISFGFYISICTITVIIISNFIK